MVQLHLFRASDGKKSDSGEPQSGKVSPVGSTSAGKGESNNEEVQDDLAVEDMDLESASSPSNDVYAAAAAEVN